jgi:hypothetical protein
MIREKMSRLCLSGYRFIWSGLQNQPALCLLTGFELCRVFLSLVCLIYFDAFNRQDVTNGLIDGRCVLPGVIVDSEESRWLCPSSWSAMSGWDWTIKRFMHKYER